jgi:hypothetical protein
VHGLLVYGYVDQVLIELHNHYLVVLKVVVEKQAQLAGPVAPLRYLLAEVILKVVHFYGL